MMIPNEFSECVALADYLARLKAKGKILAYSHIAQSTWTTSWNQKNRNKAMGVCPGVPDYLIVLPDKVVFIEMKRIKGGVVSPEQKEWLEALSGKPITTCVCKGFEEAKKDLAEVALAKENKVIIQTI